MRHLKALVDRKHKIIGIHDVIYIMRENKRREAMYNENQGQGWEDQGNTFSTRSK